MGRRATVGPAAFLIVLGLVMPGTAAVEPTTRPGSPEPVNLALAPPSSSSPSSNAGLLTTDKRRPRAAAPTTSRTDPMIRLLAQGPVVTEDGILRLDLAVESPDARPLPAGLGVAITVHRRARTRNQFQSTLAGENLGAVVGLVPPTPVSSDGRTEQFVPVELRIGKTSPGCPSCIRLDNDGVYPVNVELRNLQTDDVVDRLTTHVIRVTNQVTERPRLKVALLVPLHLAPAEEGSTEVSTTRSFIGRIEAMAGRPLVPLSIVPTPETIEALARRDDDPLLTQIRGVLAGREIISSPYVRWSHSLFERAQLTDELARQSSLGNEVLGTVFGTEPTPGVLIAGDIIPSANGLSRAGVTLVIAESTDLETPRAAVSAAAGPVLLNAGGETPTPARPMLLLDAAIERELAKPRDPVRRGGEDVLRAQHVLADLTMIASNPTSQGLAIQMPEDTPQATLDALLAGLGTTNPIIEPVTVSDLAKLPLQTRDDEPVVLTRLSPGAPDESDFPAGDVVAITGVRTRLTGYLSLFAEGQPEMSGLSREISRLIATDLTTADRRRRLNNANRSVAGLLSQVRLSQPDQLTVTARNAVVPIGVINDTGFPIRVFVTVRSSSVRLRDSGVVVDAIGTTEVRQQIDVPGRVGESDVAIETRGPGSFSMVARLTTATNLELASGRYRLRSTAVSGLGTALTLGSLLVLLVWWLRWGRGARRRSRLRHPANQPAFERRNTPGNRLNRGASPNGPATDATLDGPETVVPTDQSEPSLHA